MTLLTVPSQQYYYNIFPLNIANTQAMQKTFSMNHRQNVIQKITKRLHHAE